MVGPPARRGDRRFSRRPRGAVARRLFAQRGAREVGGLFAYVSSFRFFFCFCFGATDASWGFCCAMRLFSLPTPYETRGDGVLLPCPPPGSVSGGFTRHLVRRTRSFRTVSFWTAVGASVFVPLVISRWSAKFFHAQHAPR